MNENERIISGLEDSILAIGVLKTRLELTRYRMLNGLTNPEIKTVNFDIDAMDAALFGLRSEEKLISSLLVEYKARQD